ncbi:MAG: GNAT family N-acetyltransferase [Pseudomonadota bacterium]
MREADLAAQRDLFRLSFPEAAGTPVEQHPHYQWKFRHFPAEGRPASYEYVGTEDGVIAAYYAALPYRYTVDGRSLTAGMVCDVMTHPALRGRGLFTAMGRYATEALKDEGIAFVTGYPIRPEVIPGHLKVGWKIVQPLPVWLRPTGLRTLLPRPLRRASRLLNPLLRLALAWARPARGYRAQIVSREHFLAEVASTPAYRQLLDRWKGSVPNALEKDARFLAWRTGAPDTTYEFALLFRGDMLVGSAPLRATSLKGIDCLAVLDVIVDPAHRAGAPTLHHEIARHAMHRGMDGVACMCSRERAREYRFGRSGYLRTPAVFSLIVKRLSDVVSDQEVYDARRWHVFWIDSDDL